MTLLPLIFALLLQAAAPGAAEHEQAGLAAQQKGQLETAIAEFRKAGELDPRLAAAFFNLGAAYMQSRKYGEAIAPLERALELNPQLARIHELLGYALLSQGYAIQAIPHFEAAAIPEGLGIAQLESGDMAGAVGNLEAALAQHPGDPDLLYYLGRASGLLSQQLNDKLVTSYPASPRSYEVLAEGYSALHQAAQAEDAYLQAIAQRPDLPGAHLALGEVYAKASQWEKAEKQFREEAALRPGSAEAAFRLGSALLENGKVQEARQQLARADRLQPGMPETLYSLGKASALDGDSAAAQQSWKQVVALEPTGTLAIEAHFALAGLYRKQGKAADAEREMAEYARLKASPPGAAKASQPAETK